MDLRELYDMDQVDSYLRHTIVRVANEPVYITRIQRGKERGQYTLGYCKPGIEEENFIASDADVLDLSPVPLGLMAVTDDNGPGYGQYKESVFLSRIPARKFRIGLASSVLANRSVENGDSRYGSDGLVFSQELANTVKGCYPDIEKACKLSYDENTIIAFSRRFAVKGANLFHSMHKKPVGIVYKNVPELMESFQFLDQVLKEDMN